MTRRACVRKADVRRAVEGVKLAGATVARVEICSDGKIVVIAGEPEKSAPVGESGWDETIKAM